MHDSSKKTHIYELGINFQTSLPTILFVFFHLALKWFHLPCYKHCVVFQCTQTHTCPRAPVDLPKLETTVFSGGYDLVSATYSDYAYSYVIVLGAILPPVMFWTWTVLLTWAPRLDVYNQKRKVVFLLSYSEKQHRDFKCMSAVKTLILNSDTE